MSSAIDERISQYDLLDEERCALTEVLYRLEDRRKDRRKPEVNVDETVRKALLNAAICRGSGTDNIEKMYANVVQHLAAYRKEYRC